jgi:D-tyrosyl-tRNA(Tyr) deacylase
MRAFIQRVIWANVVVAGSEIGAIDTGLLVFLGIKKGDSEKEIETLVQKISKLRIFEDRQGKMNWDLEQVEGSVLVVSQFTLYADTRKGRRPAFTDAEEPEKAQALYQIFCQKLAEEGIPVQTGQFGAPMIVSLQNDGPVTLLLDTES